MSKMSANIEELEQAIAELDKIIPQFDEVNQNISSVASELDASWDGAASEYFIAKLRGHSEPVIKTKNVFIELRSSLQYTVKELKEADKFTGSFDNITEKTRSGNVSSGSGRHDSFPENTSSTEGSNNTWEKIQNTVKKVPEKIKNAVSVTIGGKK